MGEIVAASILALVLLFVPGAVAALLAGVRGLSAIALAPAMTYVGTGFGAQVARWIGAPWGWLEAVISWAGLALAAWAVGRVSRLHTPRSLTRWNPFQWLMVGLSALAAWILGAGLTAGQGMPTFDPSGRRGAWHDVLALASSLVPVRAAEVGMVATGMGAVWVCSVISLQRVLFPARPSLAIVGAIGSVAYQAVPAAMPTLGRFSEGAALALVPALLAWSIQLARVATLRSTGRLVRLGILFVAFQGVWLVHPLGAVAFVLFAVPAAVPMVRRLARQFRAEPVRWTALTCFAASVAIGAVVSVSAIPVTDHLVRLNPGDFQGTPLALLGAVADWTPYFRWWPNLLVAGFVVAGLIVALGSRRRRTWLAAAYALAFTWYGAAALINVGGLPPWFADPGSLAVLMSIPGIPLGSIAVSAGLKSFRAAHWSQTSRLRIAAAGAGTLAATLTLVARWIGILTGHLDP